MPEQPLVSIITPSFNQGRFIEATIQSVLAQTYAPIEYIIVDGGSTDETMDVVNRYRDRINVVIHEPDNGQSDAINKGFRRATGQLVGWINSDDVLYPNCVAEIVALYGQHPDGVIFYGAVSDWIDGAGQVFGQRRLPIAGKMDLLRRCPDIVQQGSFYRRDVVARVGYVDPAVPYCMDLDLWLRLLDHGPIYAVDGHPLAAFRLWEATKTSTGGVRFLRDIARVLRQHGAPAWAPAMRNLRLSLLKERVKAHLPARPQTPAAP